MSAFLICAWGSITTDPRNIKLKSTLFSDPDFTLDIDYLRSSLDGRMTLVVDPVFGTNVIPYLAELDVDCLEEAIQMLYDRETAPNSKLGVQDVVYAQAAEWNKGTGVTPNTDWPYGKRGPLGTDPFTPATRRQAELASNYGKQITNLLVRTGAAGIVFTALPRNFQPAGKLSMVESVLDRIANLKDEAFVKAVKYIVMTPSPIKTAIREAVDWNEIHETIMVHGLSEAKEDLKNAIDLISEKAGKFESSHESSF